ncbi:hypothetical protein F8568_045315 [Actinomadura sp. LD22]|uniref:Uncharacterized protein n=1 Tax=Actinomadura physcomitrii TaxID=2650748 RepID=A0A6I4MU03_9ACTN|nr:hypothetical protein [Actinomadura physcomitrii]MWA07427.1 hypothetical protein [Actinomadura physcomitrii]
MEVTVNGASVAHAVEVTAPDSALVLCVLDQGALVVDRSDRDLVLVTGKHICRVAAPVPLAGALVPKRTFARWPRSLFSTLVAGPRTHARA